MYFHIDGKSAQTAKFVKSRIITNVIDCVLYVDTFEQQCIMIEFMLQLTCIKDHMMTIGIDQSLSKSALF